MALVLVILFSTSCSKEDVNVQNQTQTAEVQSDEPFSKEKNQYVFDRLYIDLNADTIDASKFQSYQLPNGYESESATFTWLVQPYNVVINGSEVTIRIALSIGTDNKIGYFGIAREDVDQYKLAFKTGNVLPIEFFPKWYTSNGDGNKQPIKHLLDCKEQTRYDFNHCQADCAVCYARFIAASFACDFDFFLELLHG
ncbi:hypothetical protein WDZ92_38515 [Nostoc sp. NIES-2111]